MNFVPNDLVYLLIVVVLSFVTGLELKTFKQNHSISPIGSARTYTFIGIIGFIFYKINIFLYISGFLGLSVLFFIHYFKKLTSIISYLIMAIVYSFGALIFIYQNIWMSTLLFVLTIFILNYKNYFHIKIDQNEIETFGKFVLLSLVILPLLPKEPIKYINISPFKIWLVVVVISSISYASYLLQKFIKKGYILTAILGGLYSSTATTVVFAKKAKNINGLDSAIILATSMMYIRILIIAYIFNFEVAKHLTFPLVLFALLAAFFSFIFYKKSSNIDFSDKNPLELTTAIVFALLFVFMMFITKLVLSYYGNVGLKILSFIVGFSDIDPFVLSLLSSKISIPLITSSILIACGSNNILKAIYSLIFSSKKAKKAFFALLILGILNIGYATILI